MIHIIHNLYNQVIVGLAKRYAIIKAGVIESFRQDFIYAAENWGNLISTCAYTVTAIFTLKVVYGNVDSIAGYELDELLFYLLIGQIVFYLKYEVFEKNIDELSEMVNSGALDLLLIKPLPADFYISFKRVALFRILRDGVIPILGIAYIINWSSLEITIQSVIAGTVVMLLGLYLNYTLGFISYLPVFWWGSNKELPAMVMRLRDLNYTQIPYEGYGEYFKFALTYLFPALFAIAISTSVFLSKSPIIPTITSLIIVVTIFEIFRKFTWRYALLKYSSASS